MADLARRGVMMVLASPSGAGKSSISRAIFAQDPNISLSVSVTTRARRTDEIDGRDYHFIDVAEFQRMRANDELLESAEIYGNQYGTSQKWVEAEFARGHDVLLEIDWQGAQQIRKLMREVVSVFILPPSLEVLEERLKGRGKDTPEVMARRLAAAREEISHSVEYNYVIINEVFDRAALDLRSIIRAERLRLSRQAARHGDLINRMK